MADPTQPRIRIRPDGPYVVWGAIPLSKAKPTVVDGQNTGWDTTDELDTPPAYPLCRCGDSGNKPFCDGSHANATRHLSSKDIEIPRYEDRAKVLGGADGLKVSDDRSICAMAEFCKNRTTNVWRMVADTADPDVRAQVIEMIDHCPSGALSYTIDGEPPAAASADPSIVAVADGPLRVRGDVPIQLPDGTELERRGSITLCRCGASRNKPYCDGTHLAVVFRD